MLFLRLPRLLQLVRLLQFLGLLKLRVALKLRQIEDSIEKGLKVGIEDEVAEVRLPGQPFNKYEFNQ